MVEHDLAKVGVASSSLVFRSFLCPNFSMSSDISKPCIRAESRKYALVTGASSGIGLQYARQLAKRDYNLLIVSNENSIFTRAKEIEEEFGVDVIALERDLATQDAAKELFDYCTDNNIEIEVLVNNAGIYRNSDFLDTDENFTRQILNLHVFTPSMLIYYFGKDMQLRHKGYILNMSSITADIAVQRLSTYSATKSYLRSFSRSVHIELKKEGVYVTAVCPGAVSTNLYNLSDSARKTGLRLGYMVTPEKLAQKGLNAMFRGKWRVTPGIINHIGVFLIKLIPTWMLRLVRKWEWY